MPIHALDKMGELRKNRMQVNERIVEQYEYRMGDYTGSSCVVLNPRVWNGNSVSKGPVLEDKVFSIPV